MRRMYSENQLIELIQKYGGSVSPEDIQAMFDDGEVNLFGQYVRIMDAPKSNILTDDEWNNMKGGCFINGSFIDKTNPVIFPAKSILGNYYGAMLSTSGENAFIISIYRYVESVKAFTILYDKLISIDVYGNLSILDKKTPSYSKGFYYYDGKNLKWYNPVAQDNITSGDTIALTSDLGKAMLKHLDVEINGYRARYEYTDGNYVVYSSKTEANGGLKLQINMIKYNTTNGDLSFNQMTFTPDN